jgi:hypothetical protein
MEDDSFVGNEKSYSTSRYKASHQKVNRNTRKYKEKHDSDLKDVEDQDPVVEERKKKEESVTDSSVEHLSEEGMLQKIFDKKKNESESESGSEEGEKKNWISDEEFKRQRSLKKNKHLLKKEKRDKNRKED